MTGKKAIQDVVEFCHMVTGGYVADLTDADLMVRCVPGANHIAWQLGHLIGSDHHMLSALGHTPPQLPEGFVESHGKEAASSDDAAGFCTKNEYLTLTEQMKDAKLAAIEATADESLTQPGPEAMRQYAPTIGAVLTLLGTHWLMHAGQFVPIRRKIGKPHMF